MALLNEKKLRRKYRERALMLAFKECLRIDELAVALKIWSDNKQYMVAKSKDLVEDFVKSFERSPVLHVIKSYFFAHMGQHLEYNHIDRILTIMEDRFSNKEKDGSN